MSLGAIDNEFLFALRTPGEKRSPRELNVIYSRLNNIEALSSMKEQNIRSMCAYVRYETHKANEILYRNDDPCRCWYLLMSGSVFIQGSMFLPYASFGKQIPGTKRRGCQCVILEPSEMLAVDYPDMALHNSGVGLRPHALRKNSSNSNSRSTLDSVAEADSSSPEDSPLHRSRNNSLTLKNANGQLDNISQSSLSQLSLKENDEGEDYEEDDDLDGDSLSLHSNSSIYIKDLVIDVLKKDINDRNVDDLEILLEFTKSLRAFSNMTEPIRRALCKVMVFAWVETKSTVVLNDNELLDSWSVIINGQVQVSHNDEEETLGMGDSFGVNPTLDKQTHKGVMVTTCDDCQFLCIAQQEYYQVLHQGQENIQNIYADAGDLIMVKEKRELDGGTKKGNIVIRGTADSLINHLIQENSIDSTYIEDFLLTYRAFIKEPLKICNKLLEWFDNTMFRDKVTRVVLLWVNNHFNDFESDWHMMALLEEFEVKLQNCSLKGEIKLFNIACSAKAKPRAVTMTRESNEADLGFEIVGGSENNFPIYIKTVQEGSVAEKQGIKRGDQLLQCNGQNFEKLTTEKGLTILNKNTNLNLLLKTSLFAFKEMISELNNPRKKSLKPEEKTYYPTARGGRGMSVTMVTDGETFEKPRKGYFLGGKTKKFISKFNVLPKMASFDGGSESSGPFDDSVIQSQSRKLLIGSSATIDSSRSFKQTSTLSVSNPDLLEVGSDLAMLPEVPEDVIKVYRADQSHRFLFVNRNMTAGEAAMAACKEFGITEDLENYALYKISVQGEKFVKQSKLPEPLVKLADIPLGSRYYLKNKMNSEQLLPDENIPELLKEANFSFLDLNCFEVALHLTREDYSSFQQTEPANFIEDLFNLESDLEKFKKFEDLVNKELFWVVTTICNEPSIIQRSKIIKHFVKISHQCKIIKNLNSTFALISGLGYRAVSRMKQTWEKVPAKMNKMFEELQALMDPSRNMSKYRTLLNDFVSQPPVIPYVPVLKKDLTFLHLGNDTSVDGLINFEKMRMIGKEVRNIFRLCAVDKSQILPSAMAYRSSNQKENEKGASSTLYQTLNRRGRRSSFNNARRMYEDQVNVRRVKQYMDKFMNEIVSDEDQLMEMSKNVEPQPAPTSAQTKRRPTYAESPTRTSKTLPASNRIGASVSSNGGMATRNNSEPYLAPGHPSKKKVPVSSLPKFGANSPKALRKLMALSEEGGGEEGGKKSKMSRRSASTSSHEISPATSPYMSPKRASGKLGMENNHTIALENSNRNNNRLSLPPNISYDHSSGLHSAPMINRKFFPTTINSGSATSSSRSSIASSSSIGTMSSNPTHSSMGSLGGGSNSPRSGSPVPWGSVGSLSTTTSGSPRMLHNTRKSTNSPGRTSSSSSADTIKSSGTKGSYHEPPKIKGRNGRSSSFGSSNIVVSNKPSDRRLCQNSTSSPALNQPNSQQSLILPNLPQIPRTPSMDSGVASTGSVSADSTRFSHTDESELFARGHRVHPPLHHREVENNIQLRSSAQNSGQAGDEKVEQTFLFGCRGQWDPPRPEIKDPAFIDNYPAAIDASQRKFSMPSHHNNTTQLPYSGRHPHQIPRGFSGKSGVKGIKDYLICERHAMMQNRMLQSNNNNNNNSNFYMLQQSRHPVSKTPDALLEEQLVLELQKQKPPAQKAKRKSQHAQETQSNLVDMRRFSLSKSDPALNRQSTPEHQHPETARLPVNTSSPISSRHHHDHETVMYRHHQYGDLQITRPTNLQLSNHSDQTYINSPQTPSFHSTSTPVQRTQYSDDMGIDWQYPEKHSRSASDAGLPRTPYEVANLNATMPTIGEHYQGYNMAAVSQHRHRNSYKNYNPRQNSVEYSEDAFRHYATHREHYTKYNNSPHPNNSGQYKDNAEAENKLKYIQHYRVGSQEWSETDLDGEKRQQTMKAWGSSTSLPATPLSTKSSQILHQSLHISSRSNHGGMDVVDTPAANKPPVPQRSTSIGRTQQLRLSTNSTPPNSPPQSPTTPFPEDQTRFNHIMSSAARQSASFNANPIPNGHVTNRSNVSGNNSGSLPSYREAVHHITKQNSIYQSPISNNYRSFNMDPHESQEQVSQV